MKSSQMAVVEPDTERAEHLWTVRECRLLVDRCILDGSRFELLNGKVIEKVPQKARHASSTTRLILSLARIFGDDSVQTQRQIGIGTVDEFNDPEPDVAVLRGLVMDYEDHDPNPSEDVLLAVEVANTSLPDDLGFKASLYAMGRVREYWVLDVNARQLIVHRNPMNGRYGSMNTLGAGETITPLAAPQAAIPVADLFPGVSTMLMAGEAELVGE